MRRAYRRAAGGRRAVGLAGGALLSLLALAVLLGGCGSPPPGPPAPLDVRDPTRRAADPGGPAPNDAASAIAEPIERAGSRWLPVAWSDLPGWDADRTLDVWVALQRGCERPAAGWAKVCADALRARPPSDAEARTWLFGRLQPYRIEAADGASEGLATGYFEPLVQASRLPRAGFRVPLHAPPADLAQRRPYWTRQQLDTLPAAQAGLKGREIAYVADPLDALLLQVQGSGRLTLTEADGRIQTVRLAFAGHNDQAYRSVGRWLIEQGELKPEQASWPAIRDWARRHPRRLDELLWSNPRVVFFREEPLPDATVGPRGAQGVPLTPGRSIAVDPRSVPYGTPVWLDSTEPLSQTPLRRLVMAQDTGSAITGAVRCDYFWGWGDGAEQQAGRMKQRLRMWALWPRG